MPFSRQPGLAALAFALEEGVDLVAGVEETTAFALASAFARSPDGPLEVPAESADGLACETAPRAPCFA
eukprot:7138623-Lingulodinium_polyedra.AAC.1